MDLYPDQYSRYSRHIVLTEVGEAGLEKLLQSTVTVIGAGGLGSPILEYLVGSGIGHLRAYESDNVDISNLHRQTLYTTNDVGNPKAAIAQERLQAVNPECDVQVSGERFTPENALTILKGSHFVLDASDNFATKFLLNDACVQLGIPFNITGVGRFDGQSLTVFPGQTACYRCVFSNPPPSGSVPPTSETGILGTVPGILGTIQATEALKVLLQIGEKLAGHLLVVDALTMSFTKIQVSRIPNCPACGTDPQDLVGTFNYET